MPGDYDVAAWRKLRRAEQAEVESEAEALLAWAEPEAERREVRLG